MRWALLLVRQRLGTPGRKLSWNNFSATGVSPTPSGHAVRASGTCPGRASGTCPGRASGTCPGRASGTCPGRASGTCPGRASGTCPGRASGTCPGRASGTCPGRASGTCPGRASGTLSGISLFDSTGCSTHRPRNQLRGVATCRSGASARAAPDRWRPLKVSEARTARPLSWLESMLFLARQRPGGRRVHYSHGTIFSRDGFPDAERNFFVRQQRLFDTPAPQPVAGRRHLPKRCFGSGCARSVATLDYSAGRFDPGTGVEPARTVATRPVSILPPVRIAAARLPAWRARSCIRPANAAAPAPSAILWVSM